MQTERVRKMQTEKEGAVSKDVKERGGGISVSLAAIVNYHMLLLLFSH